MTSDNKKLHEKLFKMLALANDPSATDGERSNASAMAMKIMTEHSITQEEVFKNVKPGTTGREKCEVRTVSIKVFANTDAMTYPMNQALSDFCDCKCWSMVGQKMFAFFGLPADVSMAEFLFNSLQDQLFVHWDAFRNSGAYHLEIAKGQHAMTVMSSFRKGWEHGLVDLLVTLKMGNDEAVEKQTGTALVVIKNALVEADFPETGIKLKNIPTKKYREPKSDKAFEAGRDMAFEAGRDMAKSSSVTKGGIEAPNKRIGRE